MFNFEEELKKLPQKPGVYIMKDKHDEIIYIGKAINLKNRVRQYFQPSGAHNNKVMSMVPNISEFEYIITDNELEALILECNLIKKYSPKYNILLKDDKSYPFLKITTNEDFPRILITRSHLKDKAKYFGPYTSKMALDEIVTLVNQIWKLRTCSKKLNYETALSERPCLNYYIGKCKAPCNLIISKEEYLQIIEEVILFLNGKSSEVLKKLESKMLDFSENLEFEKAAEIRDKINAVKKLEEKQKMQGEPGDDKDIIAIANEDDSSLVQIYFVRNGKITGREHYILSGTMFTEKAEVVSEFIKQFYSENTFIPKEIVTEVDFPDRETINKYLSKLKSQSVIITVPQKGEKYQLLELAIKNANLTLSQFGEKMRRESQRFNKALDEIKTALNLSDDFSLNRIEAYDISNTQGFESVGSMVVFEKGKPKRSDYRKFKIKTVIGADDVHSMEEVVSRRINRFLQEKEENALTPKFSNLPDIMFIDGGVGQVNACVKVLYENKINIPVCGMIKDDKHRTRGLYFLGKEILMPLSSEGFKLVTRIQDEVHRFAIDYHRKLRTKKQVHSLLDDIKGVGDLRRKALLKHFGDIHGIRRASVEELQRVDTMNIKAAEAVYNFFRKELSESE